MIGGGAGILTTLAAGRFAIGLLAKGLSFMGAFKNIDGLTGGAQAFRIMDHVLAGGLVSKLTDITNAARAASPAISAIAGAFEVLVRMLGPLAIGLAVPKNTDNNLMWDYVHRGGRGYGDYLRKRGISHFYQTERGELSPEEFRYRQKYGHVFDGGGFAAPASRHQPQHVSIAPVFHVNRGPGTTREQAAQIVHVGMKEINRGIRTAMASAGDLGRAHPAVPRFTLMGLEGSGVV